MDFSYKQARATNEETVIAMRGSFLAGLNAIGRVRICQTASLCVALATMALLVCDPMLGAGQSLAAAKVAAPISVHWILYRAGTGVLSGCLTGGDCE
jgi:hypothetical protein